MLALLAAILFPVTPALADGPPAGRCVSVVGFATIRGKPLRPGDNVFVGDEIKTLEKAAVKLLLNDRSVVDVGASSNFKVTEFKLKPGGEREVDATLDFGSVRANVTKKLDKKSRFFLRTRASVLAVRGTEVFTRWERVGNEVHHSTFVSEGEVRYRPVGAPGSTPGPETTIGSGNRFTMRFTPEGDTFRPVTGTGGGGGTGGTTDRLSGQEVREVVQQGRLNDPTYRQTVVGPGGGAGGETLGTMTAQLNGQRDRQPAGLGDDGRGGTQHEGEHGGSSIPGFNGIPGTNILPPINPNNTPQLPVQLTVVLVP